MTTWSAEVVMAQSKYSESISESISSRVSQPESSSSVVPRSDDSDADCSTSSATAVNLLDCLRSPTPVDLSRKRKVPANQVKCLQKFDVNSTILSSR